MQKYQSKERDLYMVFINLEKAYDRFSKEILWKALEKNKGVHVTYIRVIKDMYNETTTSVRIQGVVMEDFLIKISLHQGSSLSHYLFTLVLDVLTKYIQDAMPKCNAPVFFFFFRVL